MFEVNVFTKNSEDAGSGAIPAGGTAITASTTAGNRISATWDGLLEEFVRYQLEITSVAGSGEWILFRMLPPVWFDSVKA